MVKKLVVEQTEAYKQLEKDREKLWKILMECDEVENKLQSRIRMSYTGVSKINIEKVVGYLQQLQEAYQKHNLAWNEYQKLDRRLDRITA